MSDIEYSYEYDDTAEYENQVNALDPRNAADMSQYHRLMIQGKSVKLPNTESIDDDLFQNFLTGFMSDIKDDERERAKAFRYLWKNENEDASRDLNDIYI